MNKYSENIDESSVADNSATTIVEFEIENDIRFTPLEDFDIDDDVITEEEFCNMLHDANEDNVNIESSNLKNTLTEDELNNLYDQLGSDQAADNAGVKMIPLSSLEMDLDDEISQNLNVIVDPSDEQLRLLKESSFQVKKSLRRMKKVSVAPGETAIFE